MKFPFLSEPIKKPLGGVNGIIEVVGQMSTLLRQHDEATWAEKLDKAAEAIHSLSPYHFGERLRPWLEGLNSLDDIVLKQNGKPAKAENKKFGILREQLRMQLRDYCS